MRVAVLGCGNVGANLLQHLTRVSAIEEIAVRDVSGDIVKAAILDVAGFTPLAARKIIPADLSAFADADIIAITAGAKAGKGESANDVLKRNLDILDQNLGRVRLKDSAVVIHLPSPVELLAAHIQQMSGLGKAQVIGFGGQLDLNRLVYVLEEHGIDAKRPAIVGEHGARAIPVYDTEAHYDAVAGRVRTFLAEIGELAGVKRNLATAPLLADLITAVVEDRGAIYPVSAYHPGHDLYLLWSYRVGRNGASQPEPLALPPRARKDFEMLLAQRRPEKLG